MTPIPMRRTEADGRELVDGELELTAIATVWAGGLPAFEEAAPLLDNGTLATEIGRVLWTATCQEVAEGRLGIGGIANRLYETNELERVGGFGSLNEIHGKSIGTSALEFAKTLAGKKRRRHALALAEKISRTIEIGDTPSLADIEDLREANSPSTNAGAISRMRPVAEHAGTGVRYVYPGLFAEATVNVLSGDPGCGKSTLISYTANCVSEKRKVLLLDRENSAPIVAERHARMGIRDGGNFLVWGGWCEREAPGPDSPELSEWVQANDPKPLLIFDSLVAFAGGVEENDAGQVRAFMQHFRRLADLGACVVVLHHSGKGENTKDYRGSSDIKAAIDSGWHLANFGEGQLERLRLRPWKCRYGIAQELVLNYRDGEFGAESTQSVTRTVTELLTDLLRANPGTRAADFEVMARDKGLGRDRARKFLDEGSAAGKIERSKGINNTKYYSLKVAE